MNLEQYADNLILKDGIWYSRLNSPVSYPEHGNESCFVLEEISFWFKHRNNCIIETVKKFATEKLFFDIGGGNGYVASGLEKAGIEAVLVEPGINGIANAKKRNLKNLVCATFEDGNFKKNSLPNIGLFDVVEHINQDLNFLQQVYQCLKPGGLIFITVPAYQFLWSNEDNDAGHQRRYTLKAIQKKLQMAGFSVKYKTYIFSFLPLPIFFFRSLPSKLGLNKKSNDIDKHKREHKNKGLFNRILDLLLNWELEIIERKKRVLFGGSCLIVGSK
jgi:SAM-dependent methyltransferase